MKDTPQIMWILNITPDSFYDGGNFLLPDDAKNQIEKMIDEGVDLIDVGWFSSRPGALMPEIDEELRRILPVMELLENYDIPVSVDTCRSEIVKEIIHFKNLRYINDISWLSDEAILPLISNTDIWYILMHIQWTPWDMQNDPTYWDVVDDISDFFEEKLEIIKNAWLHDIVLDPWFGFGKTFDHNYEILAKFSEFKKFDLPLLAGMSRKSMIWKLLDLKPSDTLPETVALHLLALQNGADILRVHDVQEHINILKIHQLIDEKK